MSGKAMSSVLPLPLLQIGCQLFDVEMDKSDAAVIFRDSV